jgi:L-fuculose-phosphate aldolase
MPLTTPSLSELVAVHEHLLQQGLIHRAQKAAFSVRHREDGMLVVPGDDPHAVIDLSFADLAKQRQLPVELQWHAAVYARCPGIRALIHSQAPCTLTASKTGQPLMPLLDDFAQIIGPRASCVNPLRKDAPRVLGQALTRRGAVVLKECGALCAGEGLEDASAAAYVCEKNAKAWIEASFLGGVRRLSRFDSYLMHWYYRFKYSKQRK